MSNWKKYKFSVPVYGAILLNSELDKVGLGQTCKILWKFILYLCLFVPCVLSADISSTLSVYFSSSFHTQVKLGFPSRKIE